MKTPDQIEQKAREYATKHGGAYFGDAYRHYKQGYSDALTDSGGDGWVSVEERLPEVGYKVLTLDGNEYVSIAFYRKSLPDGRHYFDSEEWHGPFCDISHWMPLPNPPKP